VLTKSANIAAFFDGAQVSLGYRQEPPGRIAICVTGENVVLLGNRTEVTRLKRMNCRGLKGLLKRNFDGMSGT